MDYPAPRVKIIDNDRLDLSDAYGVGVGQWDEFIVRYAYTTFADRQSESQGLARLIDDAHDRGLIYLSDADARPAGAAHPLASLWDNGSDPIVELRHVMKVRRLVLRKLGAGDLMQGRPLADFEIVLVPIYLYHRYQVAATAKLIGGFDYHYFTSPENGNAVEPVAVQRQQQALDELLKTLDPDELVIRQRLLSLLVPKPFSSLDDRERFETRTAMIFDPSLAAQIAAELTLGQILQPQRAARLAAYPQSSWGLRQVLDRTVATVWKQPVAKDERSREVQRIVQRVLVQQLITLAGNSNTSESVRATAAGVLREISVGLSLEAASGTDHSIAIQEKIERFQNRPHTPARPSLVIPAPPGSPIGN
jgi:hypothetical protein